MILLDVRNIVKHYGPDPVLSGVTFEVRPGERIGLVGPNGTGKTTLLKIISRQMEPDAGQLTFHESADLGYLEQQPQFPPGRTVWEEARSALAKVIALGEEAERIAHAIAAAEEEGERKRLAVRFDFLQHELSRQGGFHIQRKIEQVLLGLGFSTAAFHQEVVTLSGGQQNRLLLAKLLLAAPAVLLLDEPSNHLDIEATQWLENFLAAASQAMIVVSHDRYFLDKVTNRTLELYQGTVESYSGGFTAYWKQKAQRVEVQSRTYERQQEEIARMEEFVRRNHYGQKATQAEDRRKKLERIERVPPPRLIASPKISFPEPPRCGDIVLRVEHLSKGFDRPLFEDLTFDVLRGEKWGILGPNGSGKTTLLRCLLKEIPPSSGEVIYGTGVKVGYFDQLLACLDPEEPVVDAIRPPLKEMTTPQRRDLLARFGLTGDLAFQKVRSLSGGERNRAALARLAALDVNVLFLDEPTNHLDLWARDALETALKEFEGTLVFVSHDRYFLNRVCDHVIVVEPHRFRTLAGNYDTYQMLVEQRLAGAATAPKPPAAESSGKDSRGERPGKRKRKFPYRKLPELEEEIHQRESRVQELQALLSAEEVLRDGIRVRKIMAEIDQEHAILAPLYEHWEEAVELN